MREQRNHFLDLYEELMQYGTQKPLENSPSKDNVLSTETCTAMKKQYDDSPEDRGSVGHYPNQSWELCEEYCTGLEDSFEDRVVDWMNEQGLFLDTIDFSETHQLSLPKESMDGADGDLPPSFESNKANSCPLKTFDLGRPLTRRRSTDSMSTASSKTLTAWPVLHDDLSDARTSIADPNVGEYLRREEIMCKRMVGLNQELLFMDQL